MEPDSPQSRLRHQQRAEQEALEQSRATLEFAHAEEVLRHDRAQHPPPATIATRLQDSVAQSPPPPRVWWRRWLGR